MALTGYARLRTPSRRDRGGEYDPYRALDRRTKLRLGGGKYTSRNGVAPDVLAEIVGQMWGMELSVGELVEWYVKAALVQIDSNRRAREVRAFAKITEARARLARARRGGYTSYFYHRDARARAAGFSSLWAMRKARGWVSRPDVQSPEERKAA